MRRNPDIEDNKKAYEDNKKELEDYIDSLLKIAEEEEDENN